MPLVILSLISALATWFTIADAQHGGMTATGWGVFVMCTAMIGLPSYLLVCKMKTA